SNQFPLFSPLPDRNAVLASHEWQSSVQKCLFSVKVANFLTTRKAQVTCYIKWVACSCVYRGLATPNRKKNSSPLLF
ncbi:hypothetical protein PN584_18340, partial [Parabacteroides merdae]|uniref:hypothetical protein n=1 Tax=Parabacteroides merdae TaxID=46503 RepID=UPI00232BF39D